MFRNGIRKALKKGRLKLAEKGDMTMDTNSFGTSINMVSISIGQKEQKGSKVPKWERKFKVKDKTGPSRKAVWQPKSVKVQQIGRQESSHRVSVF